MANVVAVCSSHRKGTRKEVIKEGVFKEGYGLIGDAHADSCSLRQVSLLAVESVYQIKQLGYHVEPGDFAENLTLKGIELTSLTLGTLLSVGSQVVLEITQIGKECHRQCDIYRQIGKCIMPKEGIFSRVTSGGVVKTGDTVQILSRSPERHTMSC